MSTPAIDLAVQNGRVLLPDVGLTLIDIWCAEGKIAALVPHGTEVASARTINASGRVVLPGAIDAHIHLGATITIPSSPGEVQTETASAAERHRAGFRAAVTCLVVKASERP